MKFFYWLVIVLFGTITGFSQVHLSREYKDKKLEVGEDFTYVVKYAFFRLGEVRFKVAGKTKINNTQVYKTEAYIDSYPDLPFVNIHQIYESYIDSTLFPIKFYAQIFNEEDTTIVNYSFIGNSKIEMQKGKLGSSKLLLDSIATVDKRYQDGLSILIFAMMNIGKQNSLNVPCFVNEMKENTKLNFYSINEPVKIDSVDNAIDCSYLDGETNFVSVYGLTGFFEGWFSNDAFSVPIKAKMQVIIGSVTLELIKWNKMIWNPSTYKE